MKAQELVKNGTLTIEDLKNFIDGTNNYSAVQNILNEAIEKKNNRNRNNSGQR